MKRAWGGFTEWWDDHGGAVKIVVFVGVVPLAGIAALAAWVATRSHRECVEGCVSEHIEPTPGRCEWRCSFGLPKSAEPVVMPVYMPVQQ